MKEMKKISRANAIDLIKMAQKKILITSTRNSTISAISQDIIWMQLDIWVFNKFSDKPTLQFLSLFYWLFIV